MKKIILVFAAFFISVSFLKAQIALEQGPIIDPATNGNIIKIIGADETNIYVLKENGHGKGQVYLIEKYSMADFKQIYSTQMTADPKAEDIDEFYNGDNSLFFYSVKGESNTSILSVCIVNNKGETGAPLQLAQVKNMKDIKDVITFSSYYFSIAISPNKKHILTVVKSFENKGKDLVLTAVVYNSKTMEKEWETAITPGETGFNYSFKIDDNQNIFYVFENSLTGDRSAMVVDVTTKKINSTSLQLSKNQRMESVDIYKKDDQIIVGGFFCESTNPSDKNAPLKHGVFCQMVGIKNANTKTFDQQYFSDDMAKTLFPKESDLSFKTFDIEDIHVIGNEFYFVGKDILKTSKTSTLYDPDSFEERRSNGMEHFTTTSTFFNSENVIVFKVKLDGKIGWINTVSSHAKTNVNRLTLLLSDNISLKPKILSGVVNGKLLIISGSLVSKMFTYESSNVSYTLIDPDNKLTTGSICTDVKDCISLNAAGIYGPRKVFYTYGNKAIVYTNRKDQNRLGRIVFK
jgi:hypothetical protein